PSLMLWTSSIRDPELLAAGTRVINDWSIEYQRFSPRLVTAATIPFLSAETAVAEVERVAGLGFHVGSLPVQPLTDGDDWHRASWDPLWAAFAETGLVVGFHIGSEPHDASKRNGVYYRGPGGAILNYLETTFGGQRAAAKLIASGVFDRYP